MANLDLNSYDILDLLPVAYFPDSVKEEYVFHFTNAYIAYLNTCMGTRFDDKTDGEILEAMAADETTTYEEIDEFIKSKIPDYDDFQLAVSLKFKKDYLLVFYEAMIEQCKEKKIEYLPIWEEIIKHAQNDEWDLVYNLVKDIEAKEMQLIEKAKAEKKAPEIASPPPPPGAIV